jgi:phenylalanyl-tRNA synthetase beta chain
MQFPESWLRSFCNPPLSTQALAHTLTMAGLEVEELRPVAPPFSRVVVGEIVEAVQHPNADRLRVCKVDVASGTLLEIVCGAPNARVGIKVPCAMVGAQLPPGEDGKPFLIKLGKLRGVESQGMLCSAKELQLDDDHSGLLELSQDAVLGQDIRQCLNLDDTLFTLKLTPNLAHCLSVYGVAREVAALTGAPLLPLDVAPIAASNAQVLPVKVLAPDLCGRFSGRVVRKLNTQAKTPAWMVERLARCGQRSVSALVDISNYVMFESGQPTHIFDLDKIAGGLTVRWGQAGEKLALLNGNTAEVDDAVGVIADEAQLESLAGIMGGAASAVSDTTDSVYVEAAFWWPQSIAGRSRRFNFSTDAGHRFERGVDPALTVQHIERITQLILEICGTPETTCGPIDDQTLRLPEVKTVDLRVARAAKVIGMPLTQADCAVALRRLGLAFSETPGVLTVTPPSYRFDLHIEEDLIEEVVRMIGFDQLPNTPPRAPVFAKVGSESRRNPFAVRRQLAALAYQETINFSFVDERWEHELAGNADPVRLLNPIASQMNVMRSSLIGSLVQVLKFNQDRKASRVRVFELGRVFFRDGSVQDGESTVAGFHQPMRVAALAWGGADALQWGRKDSAVDFFDVKGDVEALFAPSVAQFSAAAHPAMHPGRCAQVTLDGKVVGHVGELHPRWVQAYGLTQAPQLFELELEALLQKAMPVFAPVARFPSVQRDLAIMVVDSVHHDAILAAIHAAPTQGLLQDARVFDIYRPTADAAGQGAGEHSVALRLTLGSAQATLTEEQIETTVAAVVAQLASRLGARQRT